MYNGYNFNSYQLPNYQYGQFNQMQPQPTISTSYLNGKIVDSLDVVKAMDVPIGGYGVYPKADLSEIYIKSWNPNGTTSIITYKIKEEEQNVNQASTVEEKIIARIDALENTIASLMTPQPAPALKKKEEIVINDAF